MDPLKMTDPARPRVMLIGLGGLGDAVLHLLARQPSLGSLFVCTRNEKQGNEYANLARLASIAEGYSPDIRFTRLDIKDRDAVIAAVRQIEPHLILTTATLQTWWLTGLLPPEPREAIERAGFGVWLPVHLALTLKLMQALHAADYRGITLTAPYPDVVNCVLARLGLAPTCGVGNVDEIAAKMRLLASERLHYPLDSVRVTLIAHHALERFVFGSKGDDDIPPYFLRVEADGNDMTEVIRADQLLCAPVALPSGPARNEFTAGSAVRLTLALLSGGEVRMHAPAPGGLPGGYPVLAGRGQVRPAPIDGLPIEEAIRINEESHRFDGIERIEKDGTVVFCPQGVQALRDALGYACERLAPEDAEGRAEELIARFRQLAARYGLKVER